MNDKKCRVIIVDDQSISRQLFESFIQSADDFELVYSLDTAKVADTYCARGGIDLIIMDVVMADGTSGLDAAARIKRSYPGIRRTGKICRILNAERLDLGYSSGHCSCWPGGLSCGSGSGEPFFWCFCLPSDIFWERSKTRRKR